MPPQTKAPKIREDEQKTAESDEVSAPTPETDGEVLPEHNSSLQRLAEFSPFTSD